MATNIGKTTSAGKNKVAKKGANIALNDAMGQIKDEPMLKQLQTAANK